MPDGDDVTIIHGACSRRVTRVSLGRTFHNVEVSVDMLADFAARGLGFAVESFPADWSLGRKAGPLRNERMLRVGKPDRALAFGALWHPSKSAGPNPHFTKSGRVKLTGTGDMVSRIIAAGLPMRWVPAPGEPSQDIAKMPDPDTRECQSW